MNNCISVVVPVYNVEDYLSTCIESVLKQTYKNFELVLVDDGSKDRSSEICDMYALRDNRIKVIHKINEGVSKARNIGIINSMGDYITFLDSDDYIDSVFLEQALSKMITYKTDAYVSGIKMENWKNQKIDSTIVYGLKQDGIFTVKQLLEKWEKDYPQICICGPWCKLYKREILVENNILFDEKMNLGEDTYFNLEVLKYLNNIYFDSNAFYHYRRTERESLYGKFCEDIYYIHQKVYGRMEKLMLDLKCVTMDYFYSKLVGMYLNCITHYYVFSHKTTKDMKKEIIKTISKNSIFKNIMINKVEGKKNKVLVFLIKHKLLMPVYWVYNLQFWRR